MNINLTRIGEKRQMEADMVQPFVGEGMDKINPEFVNIYGEERLRDLITRPDYPVPDAVREQWEREQYRAKGLTQITKR